MPSGRTHQRIGEILTQDGRLSILQLRSLLREQEEAAESRRERPRLGELLMRYQLIDDEDLAKALAIQHHCAYLQPDPANVRPDLFTDVPTGLLDSYQFVPLGRDDETITIAVASFDEPDLHELLATVTGLQVGYAVTTAQRYGELRASYFAARRGIESTLEVLPAEPDPEPEPVPVAVKPPPLEVVEEEAAPPIPALPRPVRIASSQAGEPIEIPFPRALDHLVYRLLQTSIRERYHNVSFSPGEAGARVLARRAGGRTDQTQVSSESRGRIRRSLGMALDVDEASLREPVCRRMRWPHDDGTAVFEAVFFPASSPQLDVNLLTVDETHWSYEDAGLSGQALALLEATLTDRPQLIVLSGRAHRDTWRLWVALLSDLASRGRKVLAFERHTSHEIPGVFHHVLEGQGATGRMFSHAGRSAFLASHTDVVAVRSDELPADTAYLLEMARADATVVLSMEAPSPLAALRRLEISSRSTVGGGLFVASYRLPRLCPCCKEGFPISAQGLPRGFQALIGKLAFKSPGCEHCQFSRQFGAAHLHEVLSLDGERIDRDGIDFYSRPLKEYLLEEGLLVPVLPEARKALLAGTIGIDDYLGLTARE